jgi:hypothetical protein
MRQCCIYSVTYCALALALSCSDGRRPVQRQTEGSRLTLSVARSELRLVEAGHREIGERIGGILLDGYNFSREISAGKAGTVLVISTNGGGGILLFRPDESYAATKAVSQPTSIQVFDLDDDGVPEVVLDEVNGRGTGLLNENYPFIWIAQVGDRRVVVRRKFCSRVARRRACS